MYNGKREICNYIHEDMTKLLADVIVTTWNFTSNFSDGQQMMRPSDREKFIAHFK